MNVEIENQTGFYVIDCIHEESLKDSHVHAFQGLLIG